MLFLPALYSDIRDKEQPDSTVVSLGLHHWEKNQTKTKIFLKRGFICVFISTRTIGGIKGSGFESTSLTKVIDFAARWMHTLDLCKREQGVPGSCAVRVRTG